MALDFHSFSSFPLMDDYYYFRCAAQSVTSGSSVFGSSPIRECLMGFGLSEHAPTFIFAPQGLWLITLLGLGSPEGGAVALTVLSLFVWSLSLFKLLKNLDFNGHSKFIFILALTLGFPPLLKSILYGQISVLLLGVFVCTLFTKKRYPFFTGCLYGILLLKPHIFSLVIAGLALCSSRRWSLVFLAGVLLSFLTQGIASLYLYPNLISDFSSSLQHFERNQFFPNINFLTASFSNTVALNYLLWCVGGCLSLIYCYRKKESLESIEFVLVSSAICVAPYIWLHDLVYLIAPLVTITAGMYHRTSIGFVAMMACSFLLFPSVFGAAQLGEGAYWILPVGTIAFLLSYSRHNIWDAQ